jgi:hypothetical protein
MIESFMCFGIGFFLAALSVLVVAFLVHGRAVRLTMRRFEHHPAVDVEVHADKDRMRAEFAMSTRINTATENPEAEKATLQAGTPVGERGRSACRNWPRAPGGADRSSPTQRPKTWRYKAHKSTAGCLSYNLSGNSRAHLISRCCVRLQIALSRAQSSSRSRVFCKPGLDQRLIGNIPLVSGNLDALKKRHWQA